MLRNYKFLLYSVLLAVLLAALFFRGRGACEAGPNTLTVSTIPFVGRRLQADAESFMALHPGVVVEIVEYPAEGYKNEAIRLFTNAETRPDVAWYWADRWYHVMVRAGMLLPLDDLYTAESWNTALPEAVVTDRRSNDGHFYSVNIDIGWTPVVYYNKTVFKELGLAEPASFTELFEVGERLQDAGYIPLAMGAKEGYANGHLFDGLLVRTAPREKYRLLLDIGRLHDEINYESPEVIEAWRLMREVGDRLLPAGVTGLDANVARSLFLQGKAAMFLANAPANGMLAKEKSDDFEYAAFFLPRACAEIEPTVGLYTGNSLMILRDSPRHELAKAFIAHVMSLERQTALARAGDFFPARIDVPDAAIQEYGPVGADMLRTMRSMDTSILWDGDIPGDLAQFSFSLHQKVLTGTITAERAGRQMQAFINRAINKRLWPAYE